MRKIHCLNAIANVGTDIFDENYKLTDNIEEADAIMVRSAAMGDMEFSENLLAIARAGAGVNNIPLERCADAGIVVFNTPGANANGVKELVICGMLLAARDVVGGIEWTRSIKDSDTIAKDVEKGKKNFAGGEIKGKKLGVIGLGAIGAEVANAAASLGLEVLGYDPFISVNAAWRLSRKIKHITDINEIFRECDYITLHVPLTDDNKGMIGKNSIPQMKDGVVILNFARDLLVDDDEMEKALESGKVARYVTDFPNTKSAKMEKAIVIPHLGASTQESEDNCAVMAANELVDYLENGNIKNSVNFPSCDMGVCQVEGRVALLHKNIPNMIGQITSAFAKNGYNISDLTNKSKGSKAYTLIDVENKASESLINELNAIEGILKVRIIK
ncbi:4-phosphoerythronate dehydrogenase [Lachnoanaerobaculum sp. MSX33]|uniref:phosphoglycerate dehydrogenase n=1 Tax=Lachnoanaerobaculum sp. MSX33 TaxID=936596 RepID=UPI0003DFA010|nr:phosphoglycerate dehydrogenase [Lachnoanaerobaculum sp. MSX33]ETO99201.1 4-phosphoerythronate dehydrogenase [Lachnoanaerobaculum sp. MSX33]MDU6629691.1 phosphoglycerate dehydrogenase [Lachnoanaerobaculum sp.]RKW39932.1 MAG: 3-phosphoglycerate dehydrogenase [Lachnospiraceae bacterium]